MTDIRPIETHYRGYRFRSRLEARWAVFLDRCRVKYTYEQEGFELPSGRYLPDFYFQWGEFLEVKPAALLPICHFEFEHGCSYPIRDDLPREIAVAGELYQALRQPVTIVYGDPLDAIFSGGKEGGIVQITKRGPQSGLSLSLCLRISAAAADAIITNAANDARAARFEHGESPR